MPGYHQEGLAALGGGVHIGEGAHHAVDGAAYGELFRASLDFSRSSWACLTFSSQSLIFWRCWAMRSSSWLLGVPHIVVVVLVALAPLAVHVPGSGGVFRLGGGGTEGVSHRLQSVLPRWGSPGRFRYRLPHGCRPAGRSTAGPRNWSRLPHFKDRCKGGNKPLFLRGFPLGRLFFGLP